MIFPRQMALPVRPYFQDLGRLRSQVGNQQPHYKTHAPNNLREGFLWCRTTPRFSSQDLKRSNSEAAPRSRSRRLFGKRAAKMAELSGSQERETHMASVSFSKGVFT